MLDLRTRSRPQCVFVEKKKNKNFYHFNNQTNLYQKAYKQNTVRDNIHISVKIKKYLFKYPPPPEMGVGRCQRQSEGARRNIICRWIKRRESWVSLPEFSRQNSLILQSPEITGHYSFRLLFFVIEKVEVNR